jgi:hypothetical protein
VTQTTVTVAGDFVLSYRADFSPSPNGFIQSPIKSQTQSQPRKQSGLSGMCGRAKRRLRAACVMFERIYGLKHLSLLTCTIPSLGTAIAHKQINELWGEIVRKFMQELRRLLKSKGLPDDYAYCVEIQEERLINSGLLCPHLHIVFVGRLPGQRWAIKPDEIRAIWNRIVSNHTDIEFDGSASTRIERIKYSVRNYLTKYMSKGSAVAKAIELGLAEQLPRRWSAMTQTMANAVTASTETLDKGLSHYIDKNLELFKERGYILWFYRVEQEITDYQTGFTSKVTFATVGAFSDAGLNKIKALYRQEKRYEEIFGISLTT